MESENLQVILELSSYNFDYRKSGIGSFEAMQGMELFESRMDSFCVFNPCLGTLNKF